MSIKVHVICMFLDQTNQILQKWKKTGITVHRKAVNL